MAYSNQRQSHSNSKRNTHERINQLSGLTHETAYP